MKRPSPKYVLVEPWELKPPAVMRRPFGQRGVEAVPSAPALRSVEPETSRSSGRLLRVQ